LTNTNKGSEKMIILALDQATVNTAYSVWVNSKLITHGKVTADEKIKDYRRSLQMVDLVMEKVDEYKPDLVVLEGAFLSGNVKTFGMLSCLRGMTMERLKDNGYKFEIVEPVTWKSALGITGKRPIQKAKSIEIAEKVFNVDLFNDDDLADSINIGGYIVSKYEGVNHYKKK
jgi:Holliday junction resolvasome RuvABC endonuclease subunit